MGMRRDKRHTGIYKHPNNKTRQKHHDSGSIKKKKSKGKRPTTRANTNYTGYLVPKYATNVDKYSMINSMIALTCAKTVWYRKMRAK